MKRPRQGPKVPHVRGPFVRLAPHPDACDDADALRRLVTRFREDEPGTFLAADLFSGAGGLSLGLEQAGIRVVLSVDHDSDAVETHRHHFAGLAVNWDLHDPKIVNQVAQIVRDSGIDVLAGGPPCQPFSKAGRSMIRYRVRHHLRDPNDQRRDLWRSFIEVVRLAKPKAVVMENVPDMALDREMFILRSIVLELEEMGYAVEERVVETKRYGVPQFRQRLILVGIRDRVQFEWPKEVERPTWVETAIGDLPDVEGGDRPLGGADGFWRYDDTKPRNSFQERMRQGVPPEDRHKIFDHITRPVRDDDREAFKLMDSKTRYSDLPEKYRRYRADIFDDKYKRLDPGDVSRTITAHIAKDGYWYIHPYQDRTITVREAARLQTFPDWYRFAGPPSSAFRQIGNAVPPFLGEVIGKAVIEAIRRGQPEVCSTEDIAEALGSWFQAADPIAIPWLAAETRWQVISAEMLLDRATGPHIRHVWPRLRECLTPKDTVVKSRSLERLGRWIGRDAKASRLLDLARYLAEDDQDLSDPSLAELVAHGHITQAHADVATLVVPLGEEDASEEPVIINKGVIRVVARIVGDDVDERNRLTDGRLAVARTVGFGPASRAAHLALMEVGARICRSSVPLCLECPVAAYCRSSLADQQSEEMLFLGNQALSPSE